MKRRGCIGRGKSGWRWFLQDYHNGKVTASAGPFARRDQAILSLAHETGIDLRQRVTCPKRGWTRLRFVVNAGSRPFVLHGSPWFA